jgi:hypothetical protein
MNNCVSDVLIASVSSVFRTMYMRFSIVGMCHIGKNKYYCKHIVTKYLKAGTVESDRRLIS